jgi:hypothetical protein
MKSFLITLFGILAISFFVLHLNGKEIYFLKLNSQGIGAICLIITGMLRLSSIKNKRV